MFVCTRVCVCSQEVPVWWRKVVRHFVRMRNWSLAALLSLVVIDTFRRMLGANSKHSDCEQLGKWQYDKLSLQSAWLAPIAPGTLNASFLPYPNGGSYCCIHSARSGHKKHVWQFHKGLCSSELQNWSHICTLTAILINTVSLCKFEHIMPVRSQELVGLPHGQPCLHVKKVDWDSTDMKQGKNSSS